MTLTQILSSTAPYVILPLHRQGVFHVSQGYGNRNPIYPRGFHAGGDIDYPEGTMLFSPVRGKIVLAQWENANNTSQGYGLYFGIQSDYWSGFRIFGCHNKELLVKAGDNVDWDTPIAISGNSGQSHGAHSHIQYQAENTFDGKGASAPFYHKLVDGIWLPTTYDSRDAVQAP